MGTVELLSRSYFSLLDGASSPEELYLAAAQGGVTHLGLADRDCVYGLVRAHQAAKESGVSLISGASLSLRGHPSLVLLVENQQGWRNLCQLLTSARAESPKGSALTSPARIAERSAGLSCVLRYGWTEEQAQPLREAFGERLALAWSRQLSPIDSARQSWAEKLSKEICSPVIATNDVLAHSERRQPAADVLNCIRRRTTLDRAGRALGANHERYLLSTQQFVHRYGAKPEAIAEARRIAERCTFSLDQLHYSYPREIVPEGWQAVEWLRHLSEIGLLERYPQGVPPQVKHQVAYELKIIDKLSFSAYFLTVYDIVRFARSRGILCQGRGSAANSAVCYVLGITSVDPSQSSLLFERFISEERGEPPDIDVDFEHERREEVIQYIYTRYGRERAALVNEVISYRTRSAIRDVGKVLGLSLDQVDRLAKNSGRLSGATLPEVLQRAAEVGLDPEDSGVQQTCVLASELRGFPRHLSIHTGGFVIADESLTALVPVEPASMSGRTVIQWDKYDVEALKFVKVDVLGLGMLTAIRKAFELLESHEGLRLDLATVPKEDPRVYDMFCRADTMGVFQIESRAQMSMLPRLRPRCFYDLVIEVALVRPGPIQGGMVHPYLRRRRGEEPIEYAHRDLEPILRRTLGVPLFQEQVMAIAVAVGGFSPGEADGLRRAMGAWRKRGGLDELGRKLVEGMLKNGIKRHYAEAIFEQLKGFGEYGFPESHATSFALLVYVSGWLKCLHPAAFTAALINSQPMGFYQPRALIGDLQRHGVEVRPIRVAHSDWDCTLERDEDGKTVLRLGMRLIRRLKRSDSEALIQARAERPFYDLNDLAIRSGLSRATLRLLARAGAFEGERRERLWQVEGLWTDLPLLALLTRREAPQSLPKETARDRLMADYASTGLSLTEHPLALLREELERLEVLPIASIGLIPNGRPVRIAGLVTCRQRPGTASGVVFMTLEDETGLANIVVWPKVVAAQRLLALHSAMLGIEGRLQRQGEAVSVLVECFWPLEQSVQITARNFR
jgi:error-prone DNA polymerase